MFKVVKALYKSWKENIRTDAYNTAPWISVGLVVAVGGLVVAIYAFCQRIHDALTIPLTQVPASTASHMVQDAQAPNLGHNSVVKDDEDSAVEKAQIDLGEFEIILISPEDSQYGIKNFAQISFVASCAHVQVCEWMQQHYKQMQNALVSGLEPMARDDLLNHNGKQKLKNSIKGRLNYFLLRYLPHRIVQSVKELKDSVDGEFIKNIFIKKLYVV